MGFDLFMGGLAVVAAALATWLIILYFRSPTSAQSSVEIALHGLRNPNPSPADRSVAATNATGKDNNNATDSKAQTRQTTGKPTRPKTRFRGFPGC